MKGLDLLGVSVHYLQHDFMEEVRAAGLDEQAAIYQIENLQAPKESMGIIRRKGAHIVSPVDGKLGASYVHCLTEKDHVGVATHMISYTWGYSIGDIIDTLVDYCLTQNLDPKNTYVWICCLCVNQHRVIELQEQARSGAKADSSVDFFAEFGARVTGVGHVLAMMAPWNDPWYLKRVWCIFEIYTAYKENCQLTIVMPPAQKQKLCQDLLHSNDNGSGMDALFLALASTRVQDAQASVESDKDAILNMVEKTHGFYTVNIRVNELLRAWVNSVVAEEMAVKERQYMQQQLSKDTRREDGLTYAGFCDKVGNLLSRNGEYDVAVAMHQKAISIRTALLGPDHEATASSFNNLGHVLQNKGDHRESLEAFTKALEKHDLLFGAQHEKTASSYNNIGTILANQGDYDGALEKFELALDIRQSVLEKGHPDFAATYNNIGSLMKVKGEFDKALQAYQKGLSIQQGVHGERHPDTARSYNNIAVTHHDKQEYKLAISHHEKAVAIREIVFGKSHQETAESYTNMGNSLFCLGHLDDAMAAYQNALQIEERFVINSHIAILRNNIGSVYFRQGNWDKALTEYEAAMDTAVILFGKTENVQMVECYTNVGLAWNKKGDWDKALRHFRTALVMSTSTKGADHPDTILASKRVDTILKKKRTTRFIVVAALSLVILLGYGLYSSKLVRQIFFWGVLFLLGWALLPESDSNQSSC